MTYLELVNIIKTELNNSPLINRVINDDIFEIDVEKNGAFPLGLFYVENVEIDTRTLTYNVNLLIADILDVNKESDQDNKDFIWNQALEVIKNLYAKLSRGELYQNNLQQITISTATPFTDRFDKGLAGMEINFAIVVKNEMTIC